MDKQRLIANLVDDLEPTQKLVGTGTGLSIWLSGSWLLVAGIVLSTGALRPGLAEQLTGSPRFALECLVGFGLSAVAMAAALRHGIPGTPPLRRLGIPAAALLLAWLGAYLYGIENPALEPSMIGKREGCLQETLLFSLAPLAFALWLMRRRVAIQRAATGALVGMAAAGIPALMMQLSCMYTPSHILLAHLLPVVGVAGLGALAGALLLPRL